MLAIGLAAAIERELERDDLAGFFVEIRKILADADALIGKAIAIVLAVLERRCEHVLAFVDGEIVGRKVLDRYPLLAQIGVHRIGAVDKIVQRHVLLGNAGVK